MVQKPLVDNAADPGQVKKAKIRTKFEREGELNDLRWVLSDQRGRRFVWRFMSLCGVFKSIWHPSAVIHYNSGQQDIGHMIMSDVVEANDESLITMMRESKERETNNG